MIRLNVDNVLRVLATRTMHPPTLRNLLAIKDAQDRHQNVDMVVLDFLDYLLILGYSFSTQQTHQNGVTYICVTCNTSAT